MADKELNIWLERFSRDIGYKSSVIVFGNTADIMLNRKNSGRYDAAENLRCCNQYTYFIHTR